MSCPPPDQVLSYLARTLASGTRDSIEAHVDACPDCRGLFAEIARAPDLVRLAALDPTREPAVVIGGESIAELAEERYVLGELLGSGGMGEVRIARDVHMRRDVAIKLMRDERTLVRFLREARVQGVLEHPNIVPAYDLGIGPDGRPYFVMKRIAGTTLEDAVAGATAPERKRLLGRLVDVCLAIELAHTRGVVHRDLKPANIMLGDFGEAYVLDWGLAKVIGEVDDVTATPPRDTLNTQQGQVLGTFGYMAPEQARGEVAVASSDVFALGCILFEVLAGTPALPRGPAAKHATLEAAEHRPSIRVEGIPPELDDLCSRATAAAAAARPTARELADGIQSYLNGDRDLERRRALSAAHAARAREALAGFADIPTATRDVDLARQPPAGDDARALAMREAGRALAIDPDNADAQALVARLILEAPGRIPAEARLAADRARARARRDVIGWIARVYLLIGLGVPAFLIFPTHDTAGILGLSALNLAMAALCAFIGRRDLPLRTPWYGVTLAANTVILAAGSLLFGPLLLVPMYIVGSLAAWLVLPTGYPPWITIVAHAISIAPFIVLETVGVLPSTFAIDGRSLVLSPPAIHLEPVPTAVMLGITFTANCISMIFIMTNSRRSHDSMLERVHSYTWHLEKLAPIRGRDHDVPA